ncbi:hypothetical protein JJC03_10165 [Flavobacterium oreochromis]|uniref:hypothetical protein n=1 Tax=Flavobacterium oreochromis TaxID=2906078 RepID=UPI001CE6DC81|nr:hypothetical protein [Flavobacterium oreochromis]QYS85575.1 hypothetical protein JJC03_10165 [Flavobacterium oreochromis]
MYEYQIDISEHGISLHEVNRDFCGGSYKGIEKDNKLELYYIQDKDERCVRVNSNYTIKKEGEKFYIKGIGGEGTFHQWIELNKVNKFE